MKGPLDVLPADARGALRRERQPEWTQPMLATLTNRPFSDPGWIFERKLDGERCLAFRRGGVVRLMSRNRTQVNGHYPELAEALAGQEAADFVVDGEVVAFDRNRTSFARLQRRMQVADPDRARRTGVAVFLYLFDVLHVDGYDTTMVPLRHRKEVLRRLLSFEDPVRFTEHRDEKGERYLREACRRGWEGLIAKRADGPYEHRRSTTWLKFKCVSGQEFVIGGYTDPMGSRAGFGALLLGYYEDGRLMYAGKVGTGFDAETLRTLSGRLRSIQRSDPPFAGGPLARSGVHWVKPDLMAQAGFTEWTRDGQLRHPRFLGLRRDKAAREVVRERPR